MDHTLLGSIRFRYLVFSITLVLVLLFAAFAGSRDIGLTQQRASEDLGQRVDLLEQSRNIRVHILEAYRSLNVYLAEPKEKKYNKAVIENLDSAIAISQKLTNRNNIASSVYTKEVNMIKKNLQVLQKSVKEILGVRDDLFKMYPSLAISNNVMRPARKKLNSAFDIIFEQLLEDKFIENDAVVYESFVHLRDRWRIALSVFRLYLANRMGSFVEATLITQEQAIQTHLDDMKSKILLTQRLGKEDRLGFEAENALEDIQLELQVFEKGFHQVVAIHHSNKWKMDIVLIKSKIAPQVERVARQLIELERKIDKSASISMSELKAAANRQNSLLWIIALLGVISILVVLLSMEKMLLKPIGFVTRALKAQAFGKEVYDFPKAKYIETRNLIDAFVEMNRQIVVRQNDLEHQATHDALTSLPNRVLFDDRIEHAIQSADRLKTKFSLMIIDLDNFKEVNDTLGHHAGDVLLQDVSARLKNSLRDSDTIARLGGDEFAILIEDCDEQQSVGVVKKIHHAFEQISKFNAQDLYVSASIGIAIFPAHGKDGQSLLRHADIAMYRAKQNHHDYSIYNAEEDEFSIKRLALSSDLKYGLEHNSLSLKYQPKLNVISNSVTGVEALLRWRHEKYGMIPPEELVEMAEHTGLIIPLTRWVLNEAIQQCAHWNHQDLDLTVSINLSVYNLKDEDLVIHISKLLKKHGLAPSKLCLEITESAMMANPLHAIETLGQLSNMGVSLAIDDFGTGFSSLAYLKQMPVNELKIDKSFVINMEHDDNDEVIVKSTVDLAHNLGLKVTAEGVETELVWSQLISMGCDEVQGYFMSKPLSNTDFEVWLQNTEKESFKQMIN
ncbi:MAG: EAL domain-containing protein [Gammaproteobacteria bacterium]|nr:EAL domain-containing protein [Gammaproteobacteria bacterium]